MSPRNILFVLTSVSENLQGGETGWYLPEVAHPYYVLSEHFNIEFAAPEGPNPPLDPSSEKEIEKDEECKRFVGDPKAQSLLANTKHLNTVDADDYMAIFYVGGRGPVIDLPTHRANIQLANKFYRSGKIVSAVCHGPAALVGVTGKDGRSIFEGRRVTAFSNAEEEEIGNPQAVPFSIEDRIRSLKGKYESANNWVSNVEQSDNLLTGQNPQSARDLAKEIMKKLQAKD